MHQGPKRHGVPSSRGPHEDVPSIVRRSCNVGFDALVEISTASAVQARFDGLWVVVVCVCLQTTPTRDPKAKCLRVDQAMCACLVHTLYLKQYIESHRGRAKRLRATEASCVSRARDFSSSSSVNIHARRDGEAANSCLETPRSPFHRSRKSPSWRRGPLRTPGYYRH